MSTKKKQNENESPDKAVSLANAIPLSDYEIVFVANKELTPDVGPNVIVIQEFAGMFSYMIYDEYACVRTITDDADIRTMGIILEKALRDHYEIPTDPECLKEIESLNLRISHQIKEIRQLVDERDDVKSKYNKCLKDIINLKQERDNLLLLNPSRCEEPKQNTGKVDIAIALKSAGFSANEIVQLLDVVV